MMVLIVGASGFIGGRLAQAFAAAGHEVICGGRTSAAMPPWCARTAPLDYSAPPAREVLEKQLAGVDVVINAVGILRESGRQTFEALHDAGPRALFAACVGARVRRVIQVSALGATADAVARYHQSKHRADRALMDLPLDWAIVQPSLVYGAGGTSARLFDMLASLPVMPLPAGGAQQVQPVHIDDLVDAVVRLAESPTQMRCVLPVVGPTPLSLREFLDNLRAALGLPRGRTLSIPRALVAAGARIGAWIPGVLLDRETLGMLERGNTGPSGPLERLLGRPPLPVARFVSPARRESRRLVASLGWLAPLLRMSIAAMWAIAGLVSIGPYPVSESIRLLGDVGVPVTLAPLFLYGAVALNLSLAVVTLLPSRPRWIWTAQIALVLVYTAIISWQLPGLWLEPFGPVAKNIPILALLVLLRQIEVRR